MNIYTVHTLIPISTLPFYTGGAVLHVNGRVELQSWGHCVSDVCVHISFPQFHGLMVTDPSGASYSQYGNRLGWEFWLPSLYHMSRRPLPLPLHSLLPKMGFIHGYWILSMLSRFSLPEGQAGCAKRPSLICLWEGSNRTGVAVVVVGRWTGARWCGQITATGFFRALLEIKGLTRTIYGCHRIALIESFIKASTWKQNVSNIIVSFTHPHAHSHTDGGGCRQEQFGVCNISHNAPHHQYCLCFIENQHKDFHQKNLCQMPRESAGAHPGRSS